MDKHSHRILSKHFSFVKNKLISFSNHFDIAKHGDIKGYGREALASEFLVTHLPDQVEFVTGEIIDDFDNRSGQIDIILQSKFSPKIPLWGNIHLSYSDSAIAAVEVKSNLTTQHLTLALESCKKIKSLRRNTTLKGNSVMKDLTTIPFIIFAFTGIGTESILKHIRNYATRHKISLDEFAPDIIVVLDKDFYICKNDGWIFPPVLGGYFRHWEGVGDENLVGLYNYLNNIIRSYYEERNNLIVGKYFEKSVGK